MVSLCAIIVIFLCSTLAFNWNYPFGCSMDFRYSLLLPVLFAPLLGRTIEENGHFACLAAPVLALFGVFSAGMMLAI